MRFEAVRKKRGFSLIELLIVVAIILIIAAIAVPSLIRARVSANESAAAANTRTIITAEVQYRTTFGVYSPDLTSMGPPAGGCPAGTPPSTNACLIDFSLSDAGTNPKSGYMYTASATNTGASVFVEGASPSVPGRTGVKTFCGTDDGIVRYNPSGGPVTAGCATLSMIGN